MTLNPDTMQETYRLVRENNQMLHAMRRNAFMWGLIKFFLYLIIFTVPIWFYITYVSGTLDSLINTMNKAQGTAVQTQSKFEGFENAVKNLRSKLPSFMQGPTATPTP